MSCPEAIVVLRETPSVTIRSSVVITANPDYPGVDVFPGDDTFPGTLSDVIVRAAGPTTILRETPSVTIYCDPET